MEPGRFIVPMFVFLAPLAGVGCVGLIGWAARALTISRGRELLRTMGAVTLILCIPIFGMLSARAFFRHTITTTFTPEVEELLSKLDDTVSTSGRLMIEDGPAWNYGDSFIVSLIPLRTGVEQIGGPYPFVFIKHNFSNFAYCHAFGKPLGDLDFSQLRGYIEAYNIHWILTASNECRLCIEESGVAEALWCSRHFALWEIKDPSTFSDTPGVAVESGYGVIQVTIDEEVSIPSGGSMLLKYHWDRALSVDPPAVISPHQVVDDPIPFIRLEPNGAKEILISVK
jgi:hypothetical protein